MELLEGTMGRHRAPDVPIRQWVLSLPWELRALAAAKPAVLGAIDRLFAKEIARLLPST